MMNQKQKRKGHFNVGLMMIAGCFLFLLSGYNGATAAITCTITNNYAGNKFITMPLMASNITVGPDLPVGKVIYRQYYKPSFTETIGWSCNGFTTSTTFVAVNNWTAIATPSGNYSSVGGYNKVYPTNVPGIGFALMRTGFQGNSSTLLPIINQTTETCSNGCGRGLLPNWAQMELLLVKTGNIPLSANNTVLASSFPTFAVDVGSPTYPPVRRFMTFNFSGQINIVSKTCMTPDVDVDLGRHDKSVFTGVGATTGWKNFNILLTDCPAFYGSYSRANVDTSSSANVIWSDGSGAVQLGPATFQNYVTYMLKPLTALVNFGGGVNGVAVESGANKATGIAIELATAAGAPITYNIATNANLSLTQISGASYQIPLKARYRQTASTVTGGAANASMEFVIAYH